MTDLSAGYLRGLREIRRVAGSRTGGTVLVVSDGHINGGVSSPEEFDPITAKARADRIVTSTLGYGVGYDETLVSAIPRSGAGNHVFAADPDAAGAAIAGEVDGLLEKVVQAASLTVRFAPEVEFLRLHNDLPAQELADGSVMVELGDLFALEQRKLLLKFKVPALDALGLARIASLELAYVELPDLVEQDVALPINVNVVPDEAAGRVAHPTVRSEVLFQEAQDVKRRTSEAFERGDRDSGRRLLDDTKNRLRTARAIVPDAAFPDIDTEIGEVDQMRLMVDDVGASYVSKMTRDSYHRGNRQRGRRPRPNGDR